MSSRATTAEVEADGTAPAVRAQSREETDERARLAMDAYARGDAAAFAEVYDCIAPRVFAYLSRQTRDAALAADLLQQTLLQMHKHRGNYVTDAPVLPWAFAIARRLLIDELRRRKTDALANSCDLADDDRSACGAPDEEASTKQAAHRVRAELARLPESQRVAFELLRVEGLSHGDAARVLGVSVSAVKLRAFRAYEALRAALTDMGETTAARPARR